MRTFMRKSAFFLAIRKDFMNNRVDLIIFHYLCKKYESHLTIFLKMRMSDIHGVCPYIKGYEAFAQTTTSKRTTQDFHRIIIYL